MAAAENAAPRRNIRPPDARPSPAARPGGIALVPPMRPICRTGGQMRLPYAHLHQQHAMAAGISRAPVL